jgi:hypothetical protein
MPLPPWSGDNETMRDWAVHQLEKFYRTRGGEGAIDPEAGDEDGEILELLDSGDPSEHELGLALLNQLASRLLGPEIADRIEWKRKHGRPKGKPLYALPPKHPWAYSYPAKVYMAKKAVSIIQDIWREHYKGKWQRSLGDIDAYDIAAEYFVVKADDVRAKASGRHKPRAKDKQT